MAHTNMYVIDTGCVRLQIAELFEWREYVVYSIASHAAMPLFRGSFFFQCTAIYTENLWIRTAGACSLVCVLHAQRLFMLTENCQVVRQDHGVVRLQDDV